jgi:anti-sigma B factor antagonist
MDNDRPPFTVERLPDTTVLSLDGRIDADADEPLRVALDEALATPTPRLVLDFSGLEYMNSTGIALVVGILGRARASGTPIAAFGLSDHYREIFRITRLADFLPVFESEADARAGLAVP